jgi:hypothetical protein
MRHTGVTVRYVSIMKYLRQGKFIKKEAYELIVLKD